MVKLSKKTKCQGCKALSTEKGKFVCSLGFGILQNQVEGLFVHPTPLAECFKPLDAPDFRKAKKLTAELVKA